MPIEHNIYTYKHTNTAFYFFFHSVSSLLVIVLLRVVSLFRSTMTKKNGIVQAYSYYYFLYNCIHHSIIFVSRFSQYIYKNKNKNKNERREESNG